MYIFTYFYTKRESFIHQPTEAMVAIVRFRNSKYITLLLIGNCYIYYFSTKLLFEYSHTRFILSSVIFLHFLWFFKNVFIILLYCMLFFVSPPTSCFQLWTINRIWVIYYWDVTFSFMARLMLISIIVCLLFLIYLISWYFICNVIIL